MLASGIRAEQAVEQAAASGTRWLSIAADSDVEVLSIAPDSAEPFLIDLTAVRPQFASLLAGLTVPIAAYDAKTLARGLLARVGHVPKRIACLRVIDTLIQGGRSGADGFSELCWRVLGRTPPDPGTGIEALTVQPVWIAQVLQAQSERLKRDGLGWVSRIEAAALPVIAEMEHVGLPFSSHRWRELMTQTCEERDRLKSELAMLLDAVDLFGDGLALEHDAGLREALARNGIHPENLRRETLARLPNPLGSKLARFRELSKLSQSYGESFLQHASADGRIHATFEQIGAPTGRMACHSPNLQSVVKDSQYRACFRASEGYQLITADYAGCELRIIAELSGDPVFRQVFAEGGDLHARVASTVFKKPVSKTKNAEFRQRAKAINFGLAYGMGAAGLSRAADISLDDARRFLRQYFEAFPRIRDFLEYTARKSLERGFAMTMTGRRLYLEHDGSNEGRARAERVAKNMPIQGTNADVVKIALARLRLALQDFDARVVNAVHDEVVVETSKGDSEQVAEIVKREMKAAGGEVLKQVPLVAEADIGDSWAK